jgi:hypothetical protein
VRRALVVLGALAALAALVRLLRRRGDEPSAPAADPRVDALRAKLAGSRGTGTPDDEEAPEEHDVRAEPAPDELRRRVHEEARAVIGEMRAADPAPGDQSSR